MSRLATLFEDTMSPEQQAVCSEVVSGTRGKVPTPMIAWLRNPELARRGQRLGEVLRFGTTLSPALVEFAVLICARHWSSHHVWRSHKRYAIAAGIDESITTAIASQRVPSHLDETWRLTYDFATQLLDDHRVTDDLYERAVALLGETGVVELVSLLGYYSLVALTVNTFELGEPGSAAPEFDNRQNPGGEA